MLPRIQLFEAALKYAYHTESNEKMLKQAGLRTIHDTLTAEIWRLNIQIQLEQEKESL